MQYRLQNELVQHEIPFLGRMEGAPTQGNTFDASIRVSHLICHLQKQQDSRANSGLMDQVAPQGACNLPLTGVQATECCQATPHPSALG